jgi:pimeloyl-ACP methyl ester carboxylesterase
MARRLATEGYFSFRFDLSGIGDSELQDESLHYTERAQRDVGEAMEMLGTTVGTESFVLVGLCSGAANAMQTAVDDERVSGCIFLDTYAFPTLPYYWRHYRSRVFDLKRWASFFRRALAGEPRGEPPPRDGVVVDENAHLPRARFGEMLQTLVSRKIRMLFVYTGLGPQSLNHPSQLKEAFPRIDFDQTATVRFYPHCDHTFQLPGDRERLLDDIEAWMRDELTAHSEVS